MSYSIDDASVVLVPLEEAIKPKGGLVFTYLNRYWAYVEGKGIVFYRSQYGDLHPQCHSGEASARVLYLRLYPWATILLIDVVHVKAKAEDYV